MNRGMFVGVISLMLFLCIGSAHATLITNGGFETGDLTGWNVVSTGEGIGVVRSANAIEGEYYAELRSHDLFAPTTLSTDIGDMNAGDSFSFSWAFGEDTTTFLGVLGIFSEGQLLGGEVLSGGSHTGSGADILWNIGVVDMLTALPDMTVAFGVPPKFFGNTSLYIDDFSVTRVTAVPEPAGLLLFVTGFFALFYMMAVRRKTSRPEAFAIPA